MSNFKPILFCFIGPGASGKSSICRALIKSEPVSYTHLDVYKRQDYTLKKLEWFSNGFFKVENESPGKYKWFDLRFGSFKLSPQHKEEFVFSFDLEKKNGTFILNKEPNRPRDGNIGAIFTALWTRIKGI